MVIKVLGNAIYYKQNIYRRWLFADEYAFRNMVMEHSTEIAACPEMRVPTLLYRATLSLPQLFCLGSIHTGNEYATTQTSQPVRSLSDWAEETGRSARSQSNHTTEKKNQSVLPNHITRRRWELDEMKQANQIMS